MKIETDDWIRIVDIEKHSAILKQRTTYRSANSLGILQTFFGVACIKKSDIKRLEEAYRPSGNPRWSEDYDAAVADGKKAAAKKKRRLKAFGPTAAEKRRNVGLAKIGAEAARRRADARQHGAASGRANKEA